MYRLKEHKRLPIVLVAMLLAAYVILILSQVSLNPSVFADIGDKHPLYRSEVYPNNTIVWKDSIGYDGQFYYAIALHLFDLLDFYQRTSGYGELPFRFQRIIYPLLARGLSFGVLSLVPWLMMLINLAAILAGCYFLQKLLERQGGNRWLVLFYGLSASTFISLRFDMPQALALGISICALYFYQNRNIWTATCILAVALLTHESAVLILLALMWNELGQSKPRRVLILSLSVVPFFIYQYVLFRVFGTYPIFVSENNIVIPPTGLWLLLKQAGFGREFFDMISGVLSQKSLTSLYSWDIGLQISRIMTILFAALVIAQGALVVREHKKGVYQKALLLQVLYALSASTLVYSNFYNVVRVLGAVFPLFVLSIAENLTRTRKVILGFCVLFAVVSIAPIPNILQSYHAFYVLK